MNFNRLDYSQIDEETFYKLPKFAGTYGDDIFAHLREFHGVCVAIKPREVSIDEFKFKVFPFSLINHALSWYSYLRLPMNCTYLVIERLFLMEFTPPAQQKALRDQIAFIQQFELETFDDYYERFLRLLRLCPNNGFPEYIRIGFLLDGMTPYERCMVDIMAGGSIINCTLSVMWDIFDARADATTLRASSKSASLKQEDITQNVQLQEEHIQQIDQTRASLRVDPYIEHRSEQTHDEMEQLSQELEENLRNSPEQIEAEERYLSSSTKLSVEVSQFQLDEVDVVNEVNDQKDAKTKISEDEIIAKPTDLVSSLCSDMITTHNEKASEMKEVGDGACINWKKRKKEIPTIKNQVPRIVVFDKWTERVSSYFHSDKRVKSIRKHVGGHWKKFDGVHPWAPNI